LIKGDCKHIYNVTIMFLLKINVVLLKKNVSQVPQK